MIARPARAPWRCSSALLGSAFLGLAGGATPAAAQDDDADVVCRGLAVPSVVAECRLAVGSARVIQPRLGAALFGGSAVPGTASTLGMRLGSLPRMSLAFRLTGAPADLPPLLDRGRADSERAFLVGFAADATLGLLSGFSPLPTVGGVLSLDVLARLGYVVLPLDEGFDEQGALGWAVGARVGALRESFTLPGVSLTATYARISRTAFGDPESGATDGFFDGAVNDLRGELSVSKRLGLVGLTGGVAWDRYSSDLEAAFTDGILGPRYTVEGTAVTERWSAHAAAAWTVLIFHLSAEVGWQEAVEPAGIPTSVELSPVGWFAGVAFRVSI